MQVFKYSSTNESPLAMETGVGELAEFLESRLIGVSRWAEKARRLVAIHAAHDNPVSLEGELGAGKRYLARLIHRCSPRRDGPFVCLTIGSAHKDLARSILFGSSQEPSTINIGERGLLELAREGTLYVGGLTDATASLTEDLVRLVRRTRFNGRRESQARLLLGREIQRGSYTWGLSSELRNGSGFDSIVIPPLRERPQDIEGLAAHFIKEHCRQTGREFRTVSPEAMSALLSYDWPRNVLELRALIMRMLSHTRPPSLEVSLLPTYVLDRRNADGDFFPASGVDLPDEVKRYEIGLICAALKRSRGLQAKAARLLRIKSTTLFMKIQRYGIDTESFR